MTEPVEIEKVVFDFKSARETVADLEQRVNKLRSELAHAREDFRIKRITLCEALGIARNREVKIGRKPDQSSAVLAFVESDAPCARTDIEKKFGFSRSMAGYNLRKLLAQGKIIIDSSGFYVPAPESEVNPLKLDGNADPPEDDHEEEPADLKAHRKQVWRDKIDPALEIKQGSVTGKILEALHDKGPATKQRLSEVTNRPLSSINRCIQQLLDAEYVILVAEGKAITFPKPLECLGVPKWWPNNAGVAQVEEQSPRKRQTGVQVIGSTPVASILESNDAGRGGTSPIAPLSKRILGFIGRHGPCDGSRLAKELSEPLGTLELELRTLEVGKRITKLKNGNFMLDQRLDGINDAETQARAYKSERT